MPNYTHKVNKQAIILISSGCNVSYNFCKIFFQIRTNCGGILIKITGMVFVGYKSYMLSSSYELSFLPGVIPRSTKPTHIRENFQVFDFSLDPSDVDKMNLLDRSEHFCWDPVKVC